MDPFSGFFMFMTSRVGAIVAWSSAVALTLLVLVLSAQIYGVPWISEGYKHENARLSNDIFDPTHGWIARYATLNAGLNTCNASIDGWKKQSEASTASANAALALVKALGPKVAARVAAILSLKAPKNACMGAAILLNGGQP